MTLAVKMIVNQIELIINTC